MSSLIGPHGGTKTVLNGHGSVYGKKRKRLLEKFKEDVFEAREAGMSIPQIATHLHATEGNVKKVLYNGVYKAERIQKMNEMLLSKAKKAESAIDYWLSKNDKAVAMWWYEKTGVVSKEQTSITINAQNAVIPLDQNMLDAARLVVAQMRAAPKPRLLDVRPEEKPTEVTNESRSNSTGGEGPAGSI